MVTKRDFSLFQVRWACYWKADISDFWYLLPLYADRDKVQALHKLELFVDDNMRGNEGIAFIIAEIPDYRFTDGLPPISMRDGKVEFNHTAYSLQALMKDWPF